MNRSIFLILAFCEIVSIGTVPASAKILEAGESFRVERIHEVPVKRLWHMLDGKAVHSAHAAIVYWQFDVENTPFDGDWRAIGIVMAGGGDVGETPVAVTVWTKIPAEFFFEESVKLSRDRESVTALFAVPEFRLSAAACRKHDGCRTASLQFIMTRSGALHANGTLIGTVEE